MSHDSRGCIKPYNLRPSLENFTKMNANRNLEDMTISQVTELIRNEYNDEIAQKFEDQKINGPCLINLAKEGSPHQYETCGLLTVGDQLKLREIIAKFPVPLGRRKKPTIAQIRSMSVLDQQVYKAKRNAVYLAAIKRWPGNDIPVFKYDTKANEELDALAGTLEESCSFPRAGFDTKGIKKHIIDVLSERRRRVRRGFDYTKGDKRRKRRCSASSTVTAESPDTDVKPVKIELPADAPEKDVMSASKQFKDAKFDLSSPKDNIPSSTTGDNPSTDPNN